MTPTQQAEALKNCVSDIEARFGKVLQELKDFKQKTFITLYETDKAKLGIYGDFYAVKLMRQEEDIKPFGRAEKAIEFYNEINKD